MTPVNRPLLDGNEKSNLLAAKIKPHQGHHSGSYLRFAGRHRSGHRTGTPNSMAIAAPKLGLWKEKLSFEIAALWLSTAELNAVARG
jgi:hypothetical protein